jgi:hypothetical protein
MKNAKKGHVKIRCPNKNCGYTWDYLKTEKTIAQTR